MRCFFPESGRHASHLTPCGCLRYASPKVAPTDVRHVQAILGHRRLETTALYTGAQVRSLARVIERSHPRERVK